MTRRQALHTASSWLGLVLGMAVASAGAHGQTTLSGLVYDGNGGPLLAGSVYVVTGDITVPVGEVLRVEAGAIVKFQEERNMFVQGTLTALGTAADPIIFTSFTDDTFAGDTNGDGPSAGSAEDWGGVTLSGVSVMNTLDHVEFHHFGDAFFGAPIPRGLQIIAPAVVTNCRFVNGRNAIRAFGRPTVANTVVDGCIGFAYTVERLDAVPAFINNAAMNCSTNAIVVITNQPVEIDTTLTTANQMNGGILFNESPRVLPGVTLSVEAGVNLKFDSGERLIIDGALVTNGTEEAPVHFTDRADDAVGGDTDGTGFGSPFSQWTQLDVRDGASANLTGTVIRRNTDGLRVDGDVTMDRCRVEFSEAEGVRVEANGTLAMTHCAVTGSAYSPIVGLDIEDVSLFVDNDLSGNGVSVMTTTGDVGIDTVVREGAISGARLSWGGTVHTGATLTLERGTQLVGNLFGIEVHGGLVIAGTPEQPVSFAPYQLGSSTSPSVGLVIAPAATGPVSIRSFAMDRSGTGTDPAITNFSPLTTMRDVRVTHARSTAFQLWDLAGDLRNCVAVNSAQSGFDLRAGSFDVLNCTSVGNASVGFGALASFTGTVRNSIAWDNALDNFFKLGLGEVFFSNGDADLAGIDGNTHVDPQFVSTLFSDLRLTSSSPMIDAGEQLGGIQGRDIAGVPRVLNGDAGLFGVRRVDMGAHEYNRLALEVDDSVAPGGSVTIELADTADPLVGTQLVLALGELEIPTALGSLFTDLTGPSAIIAWPAAPSSVSLEVPEDIPAGVEFVLQAVSFAVANGKGTVSDPEFLLVDD